MSVKVVFECSGCQAKAEGTAPLRKRFMSFSGNDYGIGTVRFVNTVEELAPLGWIAFDPYTMATYCPACWSIIEAGTSQAVQG